MSLPKLVKPLVSSLVRLRHFVPQSTLLNLYRSLIFPYLSYGLIAWCQASKSNLNKVLMLQKRVIRLVHFLPYRDYSLPFFVSSNILPIELLYFETVSVFMHDGSNDTAPENLCDAFTRSGQIHSHNTRSASAGNFYFKASGLNLMRNSVARFGTFLWNSLSTTTRKLTRKQLKRKIHSTLMNTLAAKDNYIDSVSLLQITRGL